MRHYKLKLHGLLGWKRKKNQRGKITLKEIRMTRKSKIYSSLYTRSVALIFILFSNSPFLTRQYKWRVSSSCNSPFINLKIRELRKVGVPIRNSSLFRNSPSFVTLHLAILKIKPLVK